MQVMELVELTPLQNALVGLAGVTGLSVVSAKGSHNVCLAQSPAAKSHSGNSVLHSDCG